MCFVLVPDLRSSFSNVLIPRPYGLGYTTAGPSALSFVNLMLRAKFNLSKITFREKKIIFAAEDSILDTQTTFEIGSLGPCPLVPAVLLSFPAQPNLINS